MLTESEVDFFFFSFFPPVEAASLLFSPMRRTDTKQGKKLH